MKLTIDSAKCAGHGRCYDLAPALVDADDQGYGIVIVDSVPLDQEADANRAVIACPEKAVLLEL